MTKGLTAAAILATDDTKPVMVPVKEWNGPVFIRVMTAAEREAFENEWSALREAASQGEDAVKGAVRKHSGTIRAHLLCYCLCDEAGNRLFTAEQTAELAKKSGKVVGRLFTIAQQVNGLVDDAVEEAEKNSEADRDDASRSS